MLRSKIAAALALAFMAIVRFLWDYVIAIGIGIDVTLNAALFGRKYQTISSRIGESITAGTWAAYIPWPARFRAHCLSAIEVEIV